MKRWTANDPQAGTVVSPDGLNEEFRATQSSLTTIDRTQAPLNLVNASNTASGAIAQVWSDRLLNTDGEQDARSDTSTPMNGWRCVTYQDGTSGWTNAADSFSLSGFRGGSLFGEWSGNGMSFPIFASTLGNLYPGSPKYLNLRILVNGVVFAARRGIATHEHFRIFGVARLPQGPISVDFQFKVQEADPNEPIQTSGVDNVPQAHIYSMRYLFIGRYR